MQLDTDSQNHEWRAQRLGWWGGTLLIAAAFFGLFGDGPLSRSRVVGEDGRLAVHYERFLRHGAPEQLIIRIRGPAGDTVTLTLPHEYLDAMRLRRIVPEPLRVEAAGNEVLYYLAVAPGAPNFVVRFEFEPENLWLRQARLRLGDGAAVAFDQFVFP